MINLRILKVKLFGRRKSELIDDMQNICDTVLEDLDAIQKSVQESLALILKVQEKCDKIIAIMEGTFIDSDNVVDYKTQDTLPDILDRIDKVIEGFNNDETENKR